MIFIIELKISYVNIFGVIIPCVSGAKVNSFCSNKAHMSRRRRSISRRFLCTNSKGKVESRPFWAALIVNCCLIRTPAQRIEIATLEFFCTALAAFFRIAERVVQEQFVRAAVPATQATARCH